jgi:hypothetical protein
MVSVKAVDTLHLSDSLYSTSMITPYSCTLTAPPSSSIMPKAPVFSTCARAALKKTNVTTAEDLMKQITMEKKKQEDKKKKRVEEKQAEEEKKKKSDQEKARANSDSARVSPPSIDNATAVSDDAMVVRNEDATTQTDDWTDTEDKEALARHDISPNHLFGKEAGETPGTKTVDLGKEAEETHVTKTVNLMAAKNSPEKKRTKNDVPSSVKESNQYTTKSFSIPPTAHTYSHPCTFVEAAITLTKEDKPKEFIAAIKLLLTNRKFWTQTLP